MKPQDEALVLRPLIVKAASSLSDGNALDGKKLFDFWKADTEYEKDVRLRHPINGEVKLFRVEQKHTSMEIYPPGSQGTEALYSEVHRPGQGDTPDNPIPYNNNMELHEGKYYSQNGIVYRCIRSTGTPVYNDLADLVNLYVEVVT